MQYKYSKYNPMTTNRDIPWVGDGLIVQDMLLAAISLRQQLRRPAVVALHHLHMHE
jgi:hypothetical protein